MRTSQRGLGTRFGNDLLGEYTLSLTKKQSVKLP